MKILTSTILVIYCFLSFGQTGTSSDPYTELGQAWLAPTSGIYYFDIGGTTFSSYVEAGNGWILIASGNGATAETSYTTTSSLTLQSDAILPASIYTSAIITDVRMNATGGPDIPFDVSSSAAGVLTNLQSDLTLSTNTNSTDWTGTGTARLAKTCAGNSQSLSTHIYHACGNGNNMHWQVGRNSTHERIALNGSGKNDLNLWVRGPIPLPVELTSFNANVTSSRTVLVTWETATEINNDFFSIERSVDGNNWETIGEVNGAGNSSIPLSYSFEDQQPYSATSFYRLKQTDFDGSFAYSSIQSVTLALSRVLIYPNPTTEFIIIEHASITDLQPSVFNSAGQNVTDLVFMEQFGNQIRLDLSNLSAGMYFLQTPRFVEKIRKH